MICHFHPEIKIHFADTVRDLETLSQDAEKMFKRAEQSLMQVDKMDNDQQGYCKFFLRTRNAIRGLFRPLVQWSVRNSWNSYKVVEMCIEMCVWRCWGGAGMRLGVWCTLVHHVLWPRVTSSKAPLYRFISDQWFSLFLARSANRKHFCHSSGFPHWTNRQGNHAMQQCAFLSWCLQVRTGGSSPSISTEVVQWLIRNDKH